MAGSILGGGGGIFGGDSAGGNDGIMGIIYAMQALGIIPPTNSPLAQLGNIGAAKQATGMESPYTQAAQQILQQKQEQDAIRSQVSKGDQNTAQYGDIMKNPRAMVPFMQGQEAKLKSARQQAIARYQATNGPGTEVFAKNAPSDPPSDPGKFDEYKKGGYIPSYLKEDPTSNVPSYMQERALEWRGQHPEYDKPSQRVDNYAPENP